ncbi:MAG: peptidoglycan-binding protein, partial [Pseudomonadota bacterium]
RLGSFEKYAQAGDLGGANALFAAPDTGQIEDQLRQLNGRLDAMTGASADAGQLQQIEAHIAALAHQIELSAQAPQQTQSDPALASMEEHLARLTQRVEEAAAQNSTASQMSNLEAQVGQIMRALSKQSPVAASVDLSPLESRLAGIEGHLSGSEGMALEAARHAAEQAVAMVGADTQQGQTVQALAGDLQKLQQITESGTSQTHQLHETLQAMMGRLQSIEDSVAEGNAMRASVPYAAAPMPAAAPLADPVDPAAHDQAMQDHAEKAVFAADALMDGSSDGDSPLHRAALASGFVEAPSIDPVDTMEDGFATDTILEPGAPAPVLDPVAEAAPSVVGDVRPDAVAAARRALQATTAEMSAARDSAKDEGKKSKKDKKAKGGESALAGLKDKLGPLLSKGKKPKAASNDSNTKKPIMIAAAAALLALVAFQGYSMMSGGSDEMAAVEPIEMMEPVAEDMAADVASMEPVAEVDDVREVGTEVVDTMAAEPMVADVNAEPMAPEEEVAIAEPSEAEMPTEVAVATPEPIEPAAPAAPVFDVPDRAGPAALVAAATAGEPKALFEIGMRYSNGRGVSRDLAKAAGWFEKAAGLGFAPAQYSYGSMLEKNIGVPKDIAAAADWYEKAAAQGNARAMHNLAVINAMGAKPEVQPDMDRAVDFFTKAADLGIKDSQFNLGILFGQGMGVPQDLGQAYKWFAIAAKTGDADAAGKRDEVAGMMGAGELERAREAVASWKAAPLAEAANRVTIPEAWKGKAGKPVAAGKEMIMGAQALLNQRGFDVGTPDGMVGPKTTRAIMEFQRSAGIPVTGQVDEPLMKALNI